MNADHDIRDLRLMMEMWTVDELQAFFCCVRADQSQEVASDRTTLIAMSLDELFWAYNSKLRAGSKQKSAQLTSRGFELLPEKLKNRLNRPTPAGELHQYAKSLSYEFLLREAAKKLDIKNPHSEPVNILEIYFFETIIARIIVAMPARQRHEFLTRQVQLDVMAASFPDSNWKGPVTTLVALSAAQASGFGIYMGATTALGFISHTVGVTLPFAVYTGMTSTIAFLIGPVGFVAGGGWLAYVVTLPEWSRINRALLHIIAMRAKYQRRRNQLADGHVQY